MPLLQSDTLRLLFAFGSNGLPVSRARLFVYDAGTTDPAVTFSDPQLTTPLPFPVEANDTGRFGPVYVPDGLYRIDITDALGLSLPGFPEDYVRISPIGASIIPFATAAALAADSSFFYGTGSENGVQPGDVIETAGRNFLVADSAAANQDLSTAGGVKLYDLSRRSAPACAFAAALPAGSVVFLDGLPYRAAAATGAASVTADLGVDGLVPHGAMRPGHFGIAGDGSDEGARLNTLFAWAVQSGSPHVIDFGECRIGTTVPIVFSGGDETKLVVGVLSVTTLAELGASSTILAVQGEDQIDWRAHTYLDGGGADNAYNTWLADTGAEFIDCRHVDLNNIHAQRVRRWGVDISDEVADGRIQSFFRLGSVETVDCGHRFGGLGTDTATLTADPTRDGGATSNAQTAALTMDTVPSWLKVNDTVVLPDPSQPSGFYPHVVTAISGSTVTVFPWAHSTVLLGTSVGFVGGGGVRIAGNDSNVGEIGRLRATRCATSLLARPASNLQASRVYSQFCTIPLQIGRTTSSNVRGVDLASFGAEDSCTFGPVMRTRAASAISVQGNPIPEWIGQHRPRTADDSFLSTARSAKGVFQQIGPDGLRQPQWGNPRGNMASNATNAGGDVVNNILTNGPRSHAAVTDRDPDFGLKWSTRNNEEWGYNEVSIFWASNAKTAAADLNIVLHGDDTADVDGVLGWRIGYEGGAFDQITFTLNDPGKPVLLRIVGDPTAKHWIVGVFPSADAPSL